MKILKKVLIFLILIFICEQQMQCPRGTFPKNGIKCSDCDFSCQDCVNPIECTSCKPNLIF